MICVLWNGVLMNDAQDNIAKTDTGPSKIKEVLLEDAVVAKKDLLHRLSIALRKPVTHLIIGLTFTAAILAEYVISRAMDAIWEVQPPEEVLTLNSELHTASGELREASRELTTLAKRIDESKIEDPVLREQLSHLDKKLSGLNELVARTSDQTDKVAVISQALKEDWVRLKSREDRSIDGVPDLVLGNGEGVQLCNGLFSIGVNSARQGLVWMTVAEKAVHLKSGGRVLLDDKSYVDFIGSKSGKSLFKVHCYS